MKLPSFQPPTLAELRNTWRNHAGESDVERIILEVQYLRLLLLELRGHADSAVGLAKTYDRELIVRDSPIMKLRIRLATEVLRIGEIDDTPVRQAPRNVREYARSAEAREFEAEGRRKRGERD